MKKILLVLCLGGLMALKISPAENPTEQTVPAPAPQAAQKVSPGLVAWHVDRKAALAAAKISGKPVLIFQMLGRLDELYC